MPSAAEWKFNGSAPQRGRHGVDQRPKGSGSLWARGRVGRNQAAVGTVRSVRRELLAAGHADLSETAAPGRRAIPNRKPSSTAERNDPQPTQARRQLAAGGHPVIRLKAGPEVGRPGPPRRRRQAAAIEEWVRRCQDAPIWAAAPPPRVAAAGRAADAEGAWCRGARRWVDGPV
jgi:hypothetical protein